jgi:hypothetical protein
MVVWARWFAVFAAAGLIYWCSDRPGPSVPALPFAQSDKLLHGIVYALFAGLIFRALWADEAGGTGIPACHPLRADSPDASGCPTGVLVLGAALAAAYGVTDELHQRLVPGRSCDLFDWMADGAGAALAAVVWTPLTRRFGRLK